MSYLDRFKLEAVVAAIGFNDGANKGFWRIQPRDRIKRWVEMGAELRAAIKANGKVINAHGRSVGSTGKPDEVRVLFEGLGDAGIPDGVYAVPSRFIEKVTAVLPEEYLKNKGGKLATDVKPLSVDGDVPDIADLERADVTPDDIRIANEGKEQEAFKDSPEGKAIAELPTGTEEPISGNEAIEKATAPKGSSSPEDLINNALNKAGNDEPVNVDDLIMAMKRPDKLEDDNGDDVYDPSKDKNLVKKAPEGTVKSFPQDLVRGTVVRDKDGNEQGVVLDKPEKFTASDGSTGYSFHAVLPDGTVKQLKLRREQELYTDTKRREGRNLPQAPAASDKPTPTPTPDETPKAPEAPKTPDAPKEPEAPKTPEAPPVDKTPKAPEYDGPTFIPKERPDNGQDIAFPETDENTLWAKKVAALRDENGNKVRAVDPETGEYKSTFAEDPDAVLSALLEEYPDAAVLDDGGILVERASFVDSDGIERKIESTIRRTTGANYMISYRITEPDGTSKEYFSHDYRDSFQSIHGKKNGVMRMSAILKGELSPIKDKKSKEYKAYFGTGKLEDRLKYFRGKNKSKVTEDQLLKNLARAEARGKEDEIGLAEYNLRLLREEFGGNIEAYRENATIQNMKLITLEETADKFLTGRFYLVNNAEGKSKGTVLRSAVDGIYGAMESNQVDAVIEGLKELSGRLPDLVKNPKIAQMVLDRFRAGVAKRFPDGNKSTLSALVTNGYKSWTKESYDSAAVDEAPHVSWNGTIVAPDMLVEYTNNNNDKSVGVVHSVVPSDKNVDPNSPNQYFDYIKVSFRGQDGKLQPPVVVSAKNTKVLDAGSVFDDNGDIIDEAASQLTIYTPNLKGEELRRARFGDRYIQLQKSRYQDMFPGVTDSISSGYSPRAVDPALYNVDDLTPGNYLYDSEGLPVGQIAAVRETTSESGDKGYTFAHVDPQGVVGFTSVKAGETRAPKVDISKEDGRGSSASDEGFTPNPADFQDAGLDAEGIGSDSSDAEQALVDTVADSTFLRSSESLLAIAELASLTKAKFDYENSESEEDKATAKEAYKTLVASYYTRLAKYKAMAAKFDGAEYDPASIPSDSILDSSDVVAINAKIKATHPPFKASNRGNSRPVRTYDELAEEYSKPENTYSGYLPEGWTAPSGSSVVEEERSKAKTTLTLIAESLLGDKASISDSVFDMFSKRAALELFVNDSSGEFKTPNYHRLVNATGDRVDVSTNTRAADYVAQERYIDVSASVISTLRDKLDLGDAPLTHVLQSSSDVAGLGSGGAFGYVWSNAMFDPYDNFANFHSIVDRVNRFIEDLQSSPRENFVQGRSWFAVDLSQNPELAVRYVASHELGHVMQGKILRNLGVYPSQREWDKAYGPVADSYRISQYGTSNYNEHFAESFVRWELTGEAEPQFLKFLTDARLLKNK
jgi:hypothetical protein